MRARLAAILGAIGGVAALVILAGTPAGPIEKDISYGAAQQSAGGNVYVLPSATLSTCLHYAQGTSACDAVAMGSLVVFKAQSGNSTCLLSMTSSASLGAWGSQHQCTALIGGRYIRDTPCVALTDGERADQAVAQEVMVSKPGVSMTAGICLNAAGDRLTIRTLDSDTAYLGCSTNADCSDQVSGATCRTSASNPAFGSADLDLLRSKGAVFLNCRPESANAQLHVRVER